MLVDIDPEVGTVTIWIAADLSGIKMIDLCPGVKYSGIQMVAWKLDLQSLFMVQNVPYSNGWPSHVTFHLNIVHKYCQYSDGYCISVKC